MEIRKLVTAFVMMALTLSTFVARAGDALKVVENEKVCMVTDMLFPKKQIPVTVEGKTYYGCCENCKASLAKDPKVRKAIDPVSKKSVDKATAVIAAREDGSVVYFENQKTFEAYTKKPN